MLQRCGWLGLVGKQIHWVGRDMVLRNNYTMVHDNVVCECCAVEQDSLANERNLGADWASPKGNRRGGCAG